MSRYLIFNAKLIFFFKNHIFLFFFSNYFRNVRQKNTEFYEVHFFINFVDDEIKKD